MMQNGQGFIEIWIICILRCLYAKNVRKSRDSQVFFYFTVFDWPTLLVTHHLFVLWGQLARLSRAIHP